MQNIKNIIFDYGNVIFAIGFNRVQNSLKQLGIKDVNLFFGHLQQDPIFDLLDKGEVSAADFRDYIRKKVGNDNLTDQQVDAAWNSILIGVEKGNHELLLELRKKYRTFLLSNNNEIHYQWIKDHLKREFNIDDNESLFEKTYYSHLVKKRKPELALFEQVLSENNLNPSETLFIDDSPQHLLAAEKLGLQTYLMKAPDTLKRFAEKALL